MAVPVNVRHNHEVLGASHCTSYTDRYGKYINGFTCPEKSGKEPLFCCGTSNYKYCCTKKDEIKRPLSDMTLVLGAMLGILLVVSLLTTVSCLYCQCCMLYKRRMSKMHGGPHYRLQCSNSGMTASASGGVANMYSFSAQNSAATTPLDTTLISAVGRLSRDVSQDVASCSGADHILVDVQCEIVPHPPPGRNSFTQMSSPSSQLPDIADSANVQDKMTSEAAAVALASSDGISSTSTMTSPSMVVSEMPSQTSFTVAHNRNLSTSTAGGGHTTTSGGGGSSETNSSTAALSTSFRSSCHSHDSGYSVTSDMANATPAPPVITSPTPKDENLYRSTKF